MVQASSGPLGNEKVTLPAYDRNNDKGEEGATIDLSSPYIVTEDFDIDKFEEVRNLPIL